LGNKQDYKPIIENLDFIFLAIEQGKRNTNEKAKIAKLTTNPFLKKTKKKKTIFMLLTEI